MMKKSTNSRSWLFALLSTAAIVFFIAAIYQSQRFAALSDCVNIRYQQPSLTIEAVRQALEEEKEHNGDVLDVTLWSENKSLSVTGEQQRTESLRVLLVYGNASLIDNRPCISGAYPAMGDEIGCALDQKAADALFGGNNVVGNTLTMQEKSYIVRGVFEGIDGVVIAQAVDQDESKFGALSLKVLQGVDGRETAESFLISNGLPMPGAIIDAPFLVQFVNVMVLLPAWVISLTLAVRMFLATIRLRKLPLHCMAAAAAAFGVTMVMFYAAQISFTIPDRLIPTKWSDFSFWLRLIEQLRSYAEQARTVELLLSDSMRSAAAMMCGMYSLSATMLFAGAMTVRVTFSLRLLLIIEFWTISATFLTLLFLSSLGKAVEAPRSLWLTWILYTLISNALSLWLPYENKIMTQTSSMLSK